VSSDRRKLYGGKGKSVSAKSVKFWNVKKKGEVSIPESDVKLLHKGGRYMFAAVDPADGTKLRKFTKAPQ